VVRAAGNDSGAQAIRRAKEKPVRREAAPDKVVNGWTGPATATVVRHCVKCLLSQWPFDYATDVGHAQRW